MTTSVHLGGGGGNVGAASALSGLGQSLSIKQELMDAQQQQQHREHHVALPPDYLPVSLESQSAVQINSQISLVEYKQYISILIEFRL